MCKTSCALNLTSRSMAPEREDNARLSDTEGGEKPVREKLQKAHITHDPAASAADPMPTSEPGREAANGDESLKAEPRGLQKKRSFEEVDGEHVKDTASAPSKHHTRKRSRDSTVEEDELNNGRRKASGERSQGGETAAEVDMDHQVEADTASKTPQATTPEPTAENRTEANVEDVSSPKTKRSRLLSDTPATEKAESNGVELSTEPTTATKIPATSGFANASKISPFGALAKSKSPEPHTSASAFAASGFSALAGSSASGFGSIAKSSSGFGSGGTFATGAKSFLGTKESESLKPAGFGGALGQSSMLSGGGGGSTGTFGSTASGFGRLASPGGGFGSSTGGTGFGSLSSGGLSSFASGGSAPAPLGGGSKAAKTFGAPPVEDDDDDEADEEDDKTGTKSPLTAGEDKQDERFYEQSLETGEEDETTEFTSRAKLYSFAANAEGKKEWRERGLGVLRLNVKKLNEGEDGQHEKTKARLLMRADGSHRVVLNSPVMKDMKFGTPTGGPPQGGYMLFMGTIDNSSGLELLQVKVRGAIRCSDRSSAYFTTDETTKLLGPLRQSRRASGEYVKAASRHVKTKSASFDKVNPRAGSSAAQSYH